MTKIQKHAVIFFLILNIFQVVIIGGYAFYIMVDFSKNQIKSASDTTLMQIVNAVDKKISETEIYSDIIAHNENIYDVIQNYNWNEVDGEYFVKSENIDLELLKILNRSSNIIGCIFFPASGGNYVYEQNDIDIKSVMNSDWVNRIKNSSGEIIWIGNREIDKKYGDKKKFFIVGRKINVLHDKDIFKNAYDIALLFDSEEFVPKIKDGSENLVITDSEKNIIYSTLPQDAYVQRIINHDTGVLSGVNVALTHQVSKYTGWNFYYLKTVLSPINNVASFIMIMILLLLVCIILSNYLFYRETKRIFRPIADITMAMNEIAHNNFKVRIHSNKDDELRIICDGINMMAVEIDNLFNKKTEIEEQRRKEQIRALQYQMNPHFLYNTLAAIKMVSIEHDEMIIANEIEILSRLLHRTLNIKGEMVTINFEIDNVRDYIALNQFRYKDRINATIKVDDDLNNMLIPNLLVQPLIENAIIHGLSDKLNSNQDAVLNICVRKDENYIIIEIFDNGRGVDIDNIQTDKQGNGIGIKNVNDRIRLIYGDKYGIDIESEINKFTRVIIRLPQIYGWE